MNPGRPSGSPRALAMTMLGALLVLAVGCGSNEAGSTTATPSRDVGAYGGGGGGTTDQTTGAPEDGGGGGGGGGGGEIAVQANNFAFDPTEVTAASGSEIKVKNGNANTPHTFTVDETDIDVELEPLKVEDATIDLDPGTYDFHCRFHPQMTGTLTVT